MSENTTCISSSHYLAMMEEIEQLRSGESARKAMQGACQRAHEVIKKMSLSAERINEQISVQRRKHIDNLRDIENKSVQLHYQHVGTFNIISSSIQQLNNQIQDSMRQVERISNNAMASYASAEELHRQITIEYGIACIDVNYQRFAENRLRQVASIIRQTTDNEMSPAAKKANLQSAMVNLLLADSEVAAANIRFASILHEALEISSSMLADVAGHRSTTFHWDTETHPASDIDYWTDGQYLLLEEELASIRERLETAVSNASYSMEDIEKDYTRLKELKRMQELLAASTISSIKLSCLRCRQADFIKGILKHDYFFESVAEGFDRNDERESYILRMSRPSDSAVVEVIVSPSDIEGVVKCVIRVDSVAYIDSKLLNTLEMEIKEDLQASGMQVTNSATCSPEAIDPNTPLEVSDDVRITHNIPRRKRANHV